MFRTNRSIYPGLLVILTISGQKGRVWRKHGSTLRFILYGKRKQLLLRLVLFSHSFLTRFEQRTKFQVSIRFHHIAHAFDISPSEMSKEIRQLTPCEQNCFMIWLNCFNIWGEKNKQSAADQYAAVSKTTSAKKLFRGHRMCVSVYLTSDPSYAPLWWNVYIKPTVEAAEVWAQLFLPCGWLAPPFVTPTALITVVNISTLAVGVW